MRRQHPALDRSSEAFDESGGPTYASPGWPAPAAPIRLFLIAALGLLAPACGRPLGSWFGQGPGPDPETPLPIWAHWGGTPGRTGQSPFLGPSRGELAVIPLVAPTEEDRPQVTHVIPGAIDANGLVYALARDADNSGWLFGIGIDLRPFWTYRPPYGSVSGLPLVISGGDLIVESRDERLHGPMSEWYVPLVLSVRPLEGEAWTFYPQTDALCSQYFATSLPLAGPEGTLYLAMTAGHVENQLHALGPDGSVLWQWNRSAGWRTSSALGPDGTLYLAVSESSNTRLFALGPDGQILWSTRAPGPSYTGIGLLDVIAVDPEGRLFAAGEGRLHAFSDRGQLLWTAQTPESTVTAGIAVAPDGTLLLGTQTTPSGEEPPTGWLHAFGGNGAGLWSQSLDRVPCGIPAVDAEGTAYVVARAVNTGQKSQLIAMTGAGELRFKTAFDDAFMPCGQGNNAWYVSSPMLDARGRLWFGTHSNRLLVITR